MVTGDLRVLRLISTLKDVLVYDHSGAEPVWCYDDAEVIEALRFIRGASEQDIKEAGWKLDECNGELKNARIIPIHKTK